MAHSIDLTPNSQPNVISRDSQQINEETLTDSEALEVALTLRTAAGPPRVPNAKPGRFVGPVLPCDGCHLSIKGSHEAGDLCESVFPTQPLLSQPNMTSLHTAVREKSSRADVHSSSQEKQPSTQCNVAMNPVSGMVIDVKPIQYFPSLAEVGQLNERLAFDTKVVQAVTV